MSGKTKILIRLHTGDCHEAFVSLVEKVIDVKMQLVEELPILHDISVREVSLNCRGTQLSNNTELRELGLGEESLVELTIMPTPVLLCPGCDEGFSEQLENKLPKQLQCGHAVCMGCVSDGCKQYSSTADIIDSLNSNDKCSIMRYICPVKDCARSSFFLESQQIQPHHDTVIMLQGLIDARNEMTDKKKASIPLCSVCRKSTSTRYCEHCEDRSVDLRCYCDSCDQFLHSMEGNESHRRVTVDTVATTGKFVTATSTLPICSIHSDRCTLFCDCDIKSKDKFVCEKCVIQGGAHLGHAQLTTVEAAAEVTRNNIGKMAAALIDWENQLRVTSDKILNRMEEIKLKSTEKITEVTEQFDELMKFLLAQRDESIVKLRKDRFDREVSCLKSLDIISAKLSKVVVERQELEMALNSSVGVKVFDEMKILNTCLKATTSEDWQASLTIANSVTIPSAGPCVVRNQMMNEKTKQYLDKIRQMFEVIGGPSPPASVHFQNITWNGASVSWAPLITHILQIRCLNGQQMTEDSAWTDAETITSHDPSACSLPNLLPNSKYELRICSEYILENGIHCRGPWSSNQFQFCTLDNVFKPLSWNLNEMGSNVLIDSTNPLTIWKNTTNNEWGTALTSTGIEIKPNSACGYFEMVINGAVYAMVGLATADNTFAGKRGVYLGGVGFSFGWYPVGGSGTSYSTVPDMPALPAEVSRTGNCGDAIGILVDCSGDSPYMSWFINKKQVYTTTLPLSLHNKTLYPAVCMYNSSSSATIQENLELPTKLHTT